MKLVYYQKSDSNKFKILNQNLIIDKTITRGSI